MAPSAFFPHGERPNVTISDLASMFGGRAPRWRRRLSEIRLLAPVIRRAALPETPSTRAERTWARLSVLKQAMAIWC